MLKRRLKKQPITNQPRQTVMDALIEANADVRQSNADTPPPRWDFRDSESKSSLSISDIYNTPKRTDSKHACIGIFSEEKQQQKTSHNENMTNTIKVG